MDKEKIAEVAIKFHNWMLKKGWTRHSGSGDGHYYYRSKNHHQWPPDETCEESELFDKFLIENV